MPRTGAAPRKNGSTPSALGVAGTGPGQTLGRGVGAAATAAGLSFGRGGNPAAPARALGRGVGLAPPPRSRGHGGGSTAAVTTPPATAPFSINGSCGGGFPSSSSASMGFPFPPSPSAVPFDDAGGDSSPGSWDNNLHPSGGFMSYFSNQPHNSHLVGAAMHGSPLFSNIDESSPPQVETLHAHKFYLDDNKDMVPPLGPFVLMEVWKICRDVPKWKTYNESLKNARKRKSFHLEGDSQEDDNIPDEMPKRPLGQKAAKKAALAANSKLKGLCSNDDGQSKESPIDLDKFDRYSKFQEENNEKRIKLLDRQDKLSSEKLEATKIALQTAQEYKEGKKLEKESKMMETYNNIISQDTSLMSNEEKAHRVAMMKCLMKALFPDEEML
ncbi:unnamed protein product [Urochloa decumbens]|uniref:No apical meristem-associated C-terminal domain-containing protein n=1 Tax=Urochloa decumbens TaxID=240449 RepID=A0ABC9D690_9POAL